MRRCLLLLALLAAGASADEYSDTWKRIRDAHARGDIATMREVAKTTEEDPWRLCESLCRTGSPEAAAAFAKLLEGPWFEKLPAYVDRRSAILISKEKKDARTRAKAHRSNGDPEAAVRDLEIVTLRLETIFALDCAWIRGWALFEAKRYPEAQAEFTRMADAAEELGWLQGASDACAQAALNAQLLGDLPVAVSLARRRLALEERQPVPRRIADARLYLAVLYQNRGENHAAIEQLRDALTTFEAEGCETQAADCRTFLAQALVALGDGVRAIEFVEPAVAWARERKDQSERLALMLLVLGNGYFFANEYDKAMEAAAEAESLLKGRDDWAATTLRSRVRHDQALVHWRRGDFADALSALEEEIRLKQDSGIVAGMVAVYNNIALIHAEIGDYERAHAALDVALLRAEAEGNKTFVITTHANRGFVQLRAGDYASARKTYEKAVTFAEDAGLSAYRPTILANLAFTQWKTGEPELALKTYDRALDAATQQGDRTIIALCLNNKGAVLGTLGNHAAALELRRAGLLEAQAVGATRYAYDAQAGIAATLLALGRPVEAIDAARSAVAMVNRLTANFGADEAASAREQFAAAFETGIAAALAAGDPEAACFFAESGRAGALLAELGGRDRLRTAVIPEPLRKAEADALAAEKRAVDALRDTASPATPGVRGERRERVKELEEAQKALQAVVQRIQREATRQAELLYPEAASVAEIAGALGPKDALVLYALGGEEAVAIVIRRAGASIVDLGPSAAIEAAAGTKEGDVPGPDALAALRRLVVEPLALGKDVDRLLVSADGALTYVPFTLLDRKREIAYVSSGTTLRMIRAEGTASAEGVLALGDPAYEGGKTGGRHLPPLPATGDEAREVGTRVLTGDAATESGLLAAIRSQERWHAVHLACHGQIDPERPIFSALALTPADGGDGLLTTLEIYRMTIPADLVVLSACETAKGKVHRAEGVVGFVRAFLFAGAQRVIVSLWKVDDEATKALMTKFYELWKTKSCAAALKGAQEFVASHEQWKDPRYWAAWQLWGLAD